MARWVRRFVADYLAAAAGDTLLPELPSDLLAPLLEPLPASVWNRLHLQKHRAYWTLEVLRHGSTPDWSHGEVQHRWVCLAPHRAVRRWRAGSRWSPRPLCGTDERTEPAGSVNAERR